MQAKTDKYRDTIGVDVVDRTRQVYRMDPEGEIVKQARVTATKPVLGQRNRSSRCQSAMYSDSPGRVTTLADTSHCQRDDWEGPRCGISYWITRRGSRVYRPRTHWYEDNLVRRESREYLDDYSSGYDELPSTIRSAKRGSGDDSR